MIRKSGSNGSLPGPASMRALRTVDGVLVGERPRKDEFQGHFATEQSVARQADLSHSPTANEPRNLEVIDETADLQQWLRL